MPSLALALSSFQGDDRACSALGLARRRTWLSGPVRCGLAAALMAWLLPAAAGSAQATTLPDVLSLARQQARAVDGRLKAAEMAETLKCKEADAADLALQDSLDDRPATLAGMAEAAQARHDDCESAKAAVLAEKSAQSIARRQLREAALNQAQLVVTMALSHKATKDVLTKAAAEAQTVVDGLRKKAAKVYDIADPATANAVGLPYGKLGPVNDKAEAEDVHKSALVWGRSALDAPAEVRSAVRAAQQAANRLVEEALAMNQCPADDAACVATHAAAAKAAQVALDDRKTAAERLYKDLETAGFGLAALESNHQFNAKLLRQQVDFRRVLDTNPDVKSYFGGDAIELSAGNAEGNSSIRWTIPLKSVSDSFRAYRLSLIGTTPTGDGQRTELWNSADKLTGKTRLDVVFQNTNPAFHLGSRNYVNDLAFGVSVARSEHSYLLPTDKPTELKPVDQTYSDYGLGVKWAFLQTFEKRKGLLILSLNRQWAHTASEEEASIRCPIDPQATVAGLATCTQGILGAPTRKATWLWGLDYRYSGKFDIGLNLKRSNDHKTSVDVPIYLVRNKDDEENGMPFSGGISLGWKTGASGLRWGVFVSAPLSFSKPPRP